MVSNMSWLFLLIAIVSEVCGTTCMKMAKGLTKLVPSILLFVFYGFSFTAMTLALKRIEVSVAYAIWSGLGTALIAAIGILWFKESVGVLKTVSLVLIILGVIGLNLSGAGH
jgi:small multidrug resistance pump